MYKAIFAFFAGLFFSVASFSQSKGLDAKFIAANYYKGVVKILLVDSALEKSKPGSGYIGRGTGFFVTEDGVIFTNRHVVEFCVSGYIDFDYKDASGNVRSDLDTYSEELIKDPKIKKVVRTGFTTPIVQVYHGKGESDYVLYVAKVLTIGTGSFDGAMLKIVSDLNGNPVSKGFFALPLGNSDAAQQGEDLCIYGYPAQYDGGYDIMLKDMSTLTFGKFSGLDFVFNKDYGYIKTDASINGGNSGGPVFNESNKVIGIATAVGNKTGIGLVGGVNGMYYVVAPQSEILQKLSAKGLTIPKNAGSISTILGDRKPIKSAQQINASLGYSGGNTSTTGNTGSNTSDDPYTKSKVYTTVGLNKETGSLGEEVSSVVIQPAGGYVWVIVTNKPNTLNTMGLIMDVYRKDGGEYKFHETKEYDLTKLDLKTTYYKYTFYKEGDYKLKVYNKDSKWINDAFISVSIEGGSSNTSNTKTTGGGSGDIYAGSKVYFTNEIGDKGDIGPSYSEFIINKSKGSFIYVVVDNFPNTLETDELIVDIYKKKGSDYIFFETKRYTLGKSTLNTTYFKYSFFEKGEFKIMVYNKNSKWINTGYVTIKYK
jgi:serine protease Do